MKLSGHEAEVLVVDWRRRREVVEAVEEKKGERVRREKKRRREKRDIEDWELPLPPLLKAWSWRCAVWGWE